ncbi:MAG: prepilin-type N-terminal cleavage/methylation domain-containing protein [Opitutales bacterium]|nr:prepilin-type N-terminal cleavage/methylation domain-containing protein [Opitutales bacterium]
MNSYPKSTHAFTLIEVVIAIFVFGLLSAGIISATVQARKMSEANVREATAAAVASGFLEQLYSIDYTVLRQRALLNGDVSFVIRDGATLEIPLNAGDFTGPLRIPIGANESGDFIVFMDFWIEIEIRQSANLPSLEKTLVYRWDDPFSGGVKQKTITTVRSSATVN